MSYYILPKIYNIFDFFFNTEQNINIYTSHSLFNYYNNCKKNYVDSEDLKIITNSHDYLYTNIPIYNCSVSKLKNKSNLFYDLLEIINTLNIFDLFNNNEINSIHISENYEESIDCIFLKKIKNGEIIFLKNINQELYNNINNKRYNYIFYDIKNESFSKLNEYCLNMLQILMIILKYQSNNGNCIIKINHLFYKPIIDILYILSSIYDKVIIIKPNTSNVLSFDKYIVCKNFIFNETKKELYKSYYFKIGEIICNHLQKLTTENISSIINYDLPSNFINKINDINIIFGQQQLETFDQINNILKNKNKEEKIETIKKNNIQKCVAWCEKNKIPYNKFSEKSNIFLPLKNYENIDEQNK